MCVVVVAKKCNSFQCYMSQNFGNSDVEIYIIKLPLSRSKK